VTSALPPKDPCYIRKYTVAMIQTSRTFIVVESENVRASVGETLPSGRLRPLQTARGYGSEREYIVGSQCFIDPNIKEEGP
jgi:hypothetical protein